MNATVRRPLHRHVSETLRGDIARGRYKPGQVLPSEPDLTQLFGVSRSVVRQALATLQAEGLVERSHGRGTFVKPRELHRRVVQELDGLGAQISGEAGPVHTTVLEFELVAYESAPWDGDSALRLMRLRSVDSEPVALIETYLPPACAEFLNADVLNDASLHSLMRSSGMTLESSTRTVRAVAASAAEAKHLDLGIGAPTLVLKGTTFDADDKPVEVFRTAHRGDRVAFDLDALSNTRAAP